MGLQEFGNNSIQLLADLWSGQEHGYAKAANYRTKSLAQSQQEYALAVALLFGRSLDILRADMKLSCPDDFEALMAQPMVFNLVRRIAEKRATMYREPPSFTTKAGSPAWEPFLGWGFWSALGMADLISEPCGYCPVLIGWDTESGSIIPTVIPPDCVRLEFNPLDQTDLLRATIHTLVPDAAGSGKNATLREVWTKYEYHVYKGNGRKDIAEEVARQTGQPYNGPEHGIGRVPVMVIRSQVPVFGEPLGHYDESLIQAARTINQKATELQLLLNRQANSTLVVKGKVDTKDGKASTAVTKYIRFLSQPEGDSTGAEWISPSPQAEALLKSIMDTVRLVAFFHHLPGQFSLDGVQAESGAALRMRNADLEEYRRGKIEAHTLAWGSDYADILERVMIAGKGGTYQRQDDVRIEFCDQSTVETPDEFRARLEWEVLHFLTGGAEAYLEVHPEFEADKELAARLALASAEIAKNAEAFKAANGRPASVAPPIPAPTEKPKPKGDMPMDGEPMGGTPAEE